MSDPSKPSNPILEALTKAMQSGPAQRREEEFYAPRPQSYYFHNGTSWIETSPNATAPSSTSATQITPGAIRLLSWNIDILVPFAEERMSAALDYLSTLVSSTPSTTPLVIFLQEMGQSDLKQIRETKWVQERFYLTELDERNWLSELYGTQTLVDRRLAISSVFRVPWTSIFERDGLFVDIPLLSSGSPASGKKDGQVLRLCNTHLESLVADPPVRPLQLAAAAPYLAALHVGAALLAGDLNAIQPFDRTLHSENGLKDTYLDLGGKEDSDEGYTWGQQVPQWMKDKFGPSRMDKILFRGAAKPTHFERIGIDVKVAEDKREEVKVAGQLEWVTDHYGVLGDYELEGWELGRAEEGKATAKLA
jgi:tyrosyl-DNA phosphodiesterase 2